MGYKAALLAAGAEVIVFNSFGDYQGTWLAKVVYNGETGWVEGGYGSCSYCDSFQGEFDYCYEEHEGYEERLKQFGLSYLDSLIPQEQQEETLKRQLPENGEYDYGDYTEQYLFVLDNR